MDVVIPTYNCGKYLERCLKSIFREVPVNRLIVVDKFSEDQTIDILRKYPNVEVYQGNYNLAQARNLGIKLVKTEFFCFIDSDVEVLSGYFDLINYFDDSKVGAVESYSINPFSPYGYYYHKATVKLANKVGKQSSGRPLLGGGGAIIRADAVEGIHIPECLDMYEDYYIGKYITNRGYKYIVVSDRVYALHYKSHQIRRPKHNILWYEKMCGRPIINRTFWKLVTSIPIGLYAFHLLPSPPMITWGFKGALHRLVALPKNL